MRIATGHPVHLSNREVLSHFLTLKDDNDDLQTLISTRSARSAAETRLEYPLKGDEVVDLDEYGDETRDEEVAERRGVSEELVWVQDQVIHYLCGEHSSTARQTHDGVARLADELQDHGLTIGEVLQICNLAPVLPVELYCIIEEADDRLLPDPPTRLDEIISQIRSTLLDAIPPELEEYAAPSPSASQVEDGSAYTRRGQGARGLGEEQEFVHEAEYGADKEDGIGEEREGDMD